jgi:mono/diheme cytochrome c family protein
VKAAPLVAAAVAAVAAFTVVTLSSAGDSRERSAASEPRAGVVEGRSVFARFGCGTCHTLHAARARGPIGPNLDEALPRYDRDALAAKIVEPYPDGAPREFAQMPTDFGERMTDRELDALVAFLLAAAE